MVTEKRETFMGAEGLPSVRGVLRAQLRAAGGPSAGPEQSEKYRGGVAGSGECRTLL